ncbi:arylsulfatase J [Aplysia californica]|uniref:Arylsulfatase J n=1 Tax=Aplysia californica TaxID=6500 RepID=A0ABM1AC43_APLCA|nr:arylsulfatase J [Aplysia californica]
MMMKMWLPLLFAMWLSAVSGNINNSASMNNNNNNSNSKNNNNNNNNSNQKRPNIIFVFADDYGFNDIGYHGSQISTPTLDKLASDGVKLENYYVQPLCSPTRSQLMSGRYQIHTGLQHRIFRSEQPNGLPLDSPTMADKMKEAGYATHMVGKWHLGFYKDEYLPWNRGFDSYFGKGTSLENPLFLYLAYQSVHEPLQVPEEYERQYTHIQDSKRRSYADNGGARRGGANNFPLRGGKSTLWEGGIHGVAFVTGGRVPAKGTVNRELIHVTDWFPTLVGLAQGSLNGTKPLDGVDQWDTISNGTPSKRTVLLHNIDPMSSNHGVPLYNDTFDTSVRAAIRVGHMKLITGAPGNGSWVPPPGQTQAVPSEPNTSPDKNVWLFNITADPTEHHDLSDQMPGTVRTLLGYLQRFDQTAVPILFPALDKNSNPALHGGVWGPWQ